MDFSVSHSQGPYETRGIRTKTPQCKSDSKSNSWLFSREFLINSVFFHEDQMYNRTPIEYAWWLHPAQELHHFSKGRMRADLPLWQRQMGWNEMGFNLHPSTEAKKQEKEKRACNIHHVSAGPGLTQRAKYTVNHVHGDSPECGLSFTSYISICISNVFTITAFSWAMRVITLVDTGRCIYKLNLPQMIMSNPGENSSWMRERIIIIKMHFVLFAIQWTKQTNKNSAGRDKRLRLFCSYLDVFPHA